MKDLIFFYILFTSVIYDFKSNSSALLFILIPLFTNIFSISSLLKVSNLVENKELTIFFLLCAKALCISVNKSSSLFTLYFLFLFNEIIADVTLGAGIKDSRGTINSILASDKYSTIKVNIP